MKQSRSRGTDLYKTSSTTSSSTLPKWETDPVFPAELEKEIFEIAILSFPQCAPTLALVAKRVQQCYIGIGLRIEPRIYKVLVFYSSGNSLPPLYEENELGRTKRSNFERATAYTSHAFLDGISSSIAIEVLQSCTNVTNLALWGSYRDNAGLLNRLIATLPVERLSVDVLALSGLNLANNASDKNDLLVSKFQFNHTPFVNLTHLDVTHIPKPVRSWTMWKSLALLPRLTHLLLPSSTFELVEQILEECKNIQLLVLLDYARMGISEGESLRTKRHLDGEIMDDRRVVQMPNMYSDEWSDDWISGAQGKEDIWMRTEKIQAEKLGVVA